MPPTIIGDEPMDDEPRPVRRTLSRRQILRSASIAPILGLACRAFAEPTEENIKAAIEEMCLPEAEWQKIDTDMTNTHGANYPRDKYKLMVCTLWTFFQAGVNDYSPKVKAPDSLVWDGYEHNSGQKIYSHISKFDTNGLHPSTSTCAYDCGQCAAEKAYDLADKTITKAIYIECWEKTKTDWNSRLAERNNRADVSAQELGYAC